MGIFTKIFTDNRSDNRSENSSDNLTSVRRTSISEDLIVSYRMLPDPAAVAGVSFDSIDDSVFHSLHDAGVI